MQNRSHVINKLALVLLSIVVLELVLIGDQVQPVKAIKKKIVLKKLKKLLPLLALIKPKKKIIVLPIPFPMFKNPGQQQNYQRPLLYPQQQHHQQHHQQQHHQSAVQHSQTRPHSMMFDGSGPPMSFVMMQGEPAASMVLDSSMMQPNSGNNNMMPVLFAPGSSSNSSANFAFGDEQPSNSMLMPSMTMTIQSETNGGSNIELSTNMMAGASNQPTVANNSSRLRAPPASSSKWRPSPNNLEQQLFDEQSPADLQQQQNQPGGEHYYSSPWSAKSALSSPAKVYRQRTPQSGRLQQSRQQQQQPKAVIMIRNQWRPNPAQLQHQQQHLQQHLIQAPEFEELIPVGPAQMLPVYQTSNGQLHMSPPSTVASSDQHQQHQHQHQQHQATNNADSEVALLTDRPQQSGRSGNSSRPAAARLMSSPSSSSAAVKGKQQSQPLGGY